MTPQEIAEAKKAVEAALASGQIIIVPAQSNPTPKPARKRYPRNAGSNAAYLAMYHERNRANGLCTNCGGKREGQTRLCDSCREAQRMSERKAYERYVAEGLCTNCGRERDYINARTGKTALRCRRCRDMNAARTARSRSTK